MKTQANLKKRPIPYMYEKFEVFASYPNPLSQVKSSMTRIFNSLAYLLNSEVYLPRYICIVPDRNVVDNLNFKEHGLGEVMEKIAKWLVNQVDRSLESRIEELKSKHAGALDFCTVIWIAILKRPTDETTADSRGSQFPLAFSTARRKFNTALEDHLANIESSMMFMETDDLTHGANFDNRNKLNGNGKWQFWKEVDHILKKFDRGQISLDPIQQTRVARRALPSPPRRRHSEDHSRSHNSKY